MFSQMITSETISQPKEFFTVFWTTELGKGMIAISATTSFTLEQLKLVDIRNSLEGI